MKTQSAIIVIAATVIIILLLVLVQSQNPEIGGNLEQNGKKEAPADTKTPESPASPPAASAPAPSQEGSFGLKISEPAPGATFYRGAKYSVRWSGIFTDRIKIYLRKRSTGSNTLLVSDIYASVQKYDWTVPTTLTPASDYYFSIIPQIQQYSKPATSAEFTIGDSSVISKTNSKIEASPASLSAEANCYGTITVTAINEYGLPLANQKVEIVSNRPQDPIIAVRDTTNSLGSAVFKTGSLAPGTGIFTAKIAGTTINDTGVISFFAPPPFCSTR